MRLEEFWRKKAAEKAKKYDGPSVRVASVNGGDHLLAHHISSIQKIDTATSQSNYHVLDDYPSNKSDAEQDLSLGNSGTSAILATNIFTRDSVSTFMQDKLGYNGHEGNNETSSPYQVYPTLHLELDKTSLCFLIWGKKFSGSVADMGRVNHLSQWNSDHIYVDHNFDAQISSSHAPSSPPVGGRRSCPSFLDSIQISRSPSSSPPLSKVYPPDSLASSVSQRYANSSIASDNGVDLFNHVPENKHDFFSQKQNEDFAALEQHIEDLTQEKFSLQHSLEASRALAESLASENSALTDSFNQQGSIVNQLKLDLEKLQQEIKAQLLMNMQSYWLLKLLGWKRRLSIAQLCISFCILHKEECMQYPFNWAFYLFCPLIWVVDGGYIDAWDMHFRCGGRVKALRLRSNELKLERQLENSQAEISSYRKKMSSLEKDRQDLQSTIDALQEEKILLQSKLRKASASENSFDVNKTSYSTKDVSTSTEDLDINATTETSNSENLRDDAPSSQFPHENIPLSLEGLPLTIPSDQIRMVQNINTLIAELALEKDQLMQALSAESSQSSKLLELNKELTRKLEAQTQRLELLTAQCMADDNFQPRQLDPRTVHENTKYADEGDEVVERVLGWIMKLFPGGPSRRRTSKHL
ncbi:hypothetical protein Pfo_016259 [Paulownia fortunei]|nr:hypothetical protein Pfo_016259 [Paulownia fortunei]